MIFPNQILGACYTPPFNSKVTTEATSTSLVIYTISTMWVLYIIDALYNNDTLESN